MKRSILTVIITFVITALVLAGTSYAYYRINLGGKEDLGINIVTHEIDPELTITKNCDLEISVTLNDMQKDDGTETGAPILGNQCNLTATMSTSPKVTCQYKATYKRTNGDKFTYSEANTSNKPEYILSVSRTASSGITLSSSAPASIIDITNKSSFVIDSGTITFAANSSSASLTYDLQQKFNNYDFVQNDNAGKTVRGKVILEIDNCDIGDEPYSMSISDSYLDKTKFQSFASTNTPTEIIFTNSGAPASGTTNVSDTTNGDIVAWMNGTKMMVSTIEEGKYVKAPVNSSSLFTNFSSSGWQSNLTNIDLTYLDTSNVTNMSAMFYECNKLTSLDVSNFDTSEVTDMFSMFSGCISLTSLDVSNFDTLEVTNMSSMFRQCNNLTSLEVSNFDTSKVTNMSQMFERCTLLTSLDLSNFDTSNVESMYIMFESCTSLISLDLSSFDTSKVTNMSRMFYICRNLTNIYVSSRWNTDAVTDSNIMFTACTKLPNYSSSYTDKTKAISTTEGGYLTLKTAFLTDSWETIKNNIQSGNTSMYHVGDTKTITLAAHENDCPTYTGSGTSESPYVCGAPTTTPEKTYQVRIANMSSPDAECNNPNYSQTACGFVVEFAEIIENHVFNPGGLDTANGTSSDEYIYGSSRGGYPATSLYNFINGTLYNAFPKEVRDVMIPTKVVSGYGKLDTSNFVSNDYLYLLDSKEIYGPTYTISYNKAKDVERQLDYYESIGVTYSDYSGAVKKLGTSNRAWWVRSATSYYSRIFYSVNSGGSSGSYNAYTNYGVSVAFRIG